MKSLCAMLAGLFCLAVGYAQKNYDAAGIPKDLRENAHVVKRFEEIKFHVKDVDKAVYSVHRVYTVLDEEGASKLSFSAHTTRFIKIDEFEVKIYNASGELAKKFRKRDLTQHPILDGLVSDGHVFSISPGVTHYPATIEYKYEIEYSGTAWYPAYVLHEPGESVETSSYTAVVPAELDLRFKAQHTSAAPVISVEGGTKKYVWSIKNVKALTDEEDELSEANVNPTIVFAPNRFRVYNTYGDMSTWKSFGMWSHELMKGLDELPADRKAFFESLVKNAKSDREKVAIVYEYLQKNFRYVSIQLGIGGWKPFPVSFTDEKKYGDCKGLSFFMYSVLKSLGIKSHCALVYRNTNQESADPEFPNNRFNHVILCVPQKADSIWLECTSNTAEFGVLDATTTDKNALLITDNGGVLVPTPAGNLMSNSFSTTTDIWLEENGSGISKTQLFTRGEFRDVMLGMIEAKKDDQKMMIVRGLGFNQPDDFTIETGSKADVMDLKIKLSIEKIPQFQAGNKMFLNPRLNSLWIYKLPENTGRKTDYYFRFPFFKSDTTIYHLPEGFTAEVLPKAAKIKCQYAEYESEFTYNSEQRMIMSVARMKLYKNRIPANEYATVKSFFDKLISDENQKLIVKRN